MKLVKRWMNGEVMRVPADAFTQIHGTLFKVNPNMIIARSLHSLVIRHPDDVAIFKEPPLSPRGTPTATT